MRIIKSSAALAIAVIVSAGCNSARYVHRDNELGIVAIPENNSQWPYYHKDDASELMREHFPQGYVIESEEEVVVGQTTNSRERNPAGVNLGLVSFGLGKTRGTSETTNKTEYRIRYRPRPAPYARQAAHVEQPPAYR